MTIINKILEWARERGYTAVYGSAEQVNEMLNNTPFADSEDGTVVVMHLVTDSATVDGHDRAVVAVYFASLCDFDFEGEQLLPEQERLKGIGKELLNHIRTGNDMTYSDPRWQYGYDDYAENVCWVCLRVTLTASAADCVPFSPEPPTPPTPPPYSYDLFCPQIVYPLPVVTGMPNPVWYNRLYINIVVSEDAASAIQGSYSALVPWAGEKCTSRMQVLSSHSLLSVDRINYFKNAMQSQGLPMTEETEQWLTERIGKVIFNIEISRATRAETPILGVDSATHYESKPVTAL